MRKIHVTRQFLRHAAVTVIFSKKQKKPFLDKVNGSMWAKFQVCIVFRWPGGVAQIHTQINTYTSEIRNILDRLSP